MRGTRLPRYFLGFFLSRGDTHSLGNYSSIQILEVWRVSHKQLHELVQVGYRTEKLAWILEVTPSWDNLLLSIYGLVLFAGVRGSHVLLRYKVCSDIIDIHMLYHRGHGQSRRKVCHEIASIHAVNEKMRQELRQI